jgi:PBSX family phage terminase large subunit
MKKKTNPFVWQKFSKKQLKVMTWWTNNSPHKDADGIIADGAVRSGKTIVMAPSFVNWAMETFNDQDFAMCGKTIGALRRNVINTLKKQLLSLGLEVEDKRSENLLIVTKGYITNNFYLFGGKDEGSQDLIQGMTLAGVFFDEVALMPQSFVTQAEARCSVEGAKYWYNCNPKGPNHYFKKEYIDMAKNKNLYYLHFLMEDNLTMSDKTRERYKNRFFGVFYKRNVLGLWVTAEGKIYTTFTENNVIKTKEWYEKDENGKWKHPLRQSIILATIGIDFGGNKSSTAFNCTTFTRGYKDIITVKERRYKQELDPGTLEKNFIEFVIECKAEYPNLVTAYADSAEQILIRGLKLAVLRAKLAITISNAKKKEIIDRIRFYCALMGQIRYHIVDCCPETIQAFDDAVWEQDEKKAKEEDVRLDDGSTNIDNLDAQEYSTEPFMKVMIDTR